MSDSITNPQISVEKVKGSMEDNVLNPVSQEERVSGWSLLANTAGVGTTLAMLLVGGTSSYLIGVGWTVVAAAISATFGAFISTWTGQVAQSTGMSSTVSTRDRFAYLCVDDLELPGIRKCFTLQWDFVLTWLGTDHP